MSVDDTPGQVAKHVVRVSRDDYADVIIFDDGSSTIETFRRKLNPLYTVLLGLQVLFFLVGIVLMFASAHPNGGFGLVGLSIAVAALILAFVPKYVRGGRINYG
jgi:hypothetical protein